MSTRTITYRDYTTSHLPISHTIEDALNNYISSYSHDSMQDRLITVVAKILETLPDHQIIEILEYDEAKHG